MEGRGEICKDQVHMTFMKTGVAVREAVCSGYLPVTKFSIIKQSVISIKACNSYSYLLGIWLQKLVINRLIGY